MSDFYTGIASDALDLLTELVQAVTIRRTTTVYVPPVTTSTVPETTTTTTTTEPEPAPTTTLPPPIETTTTTSTTPTTTTSTVAPVTTTQPDVTTTLQSPSDEPEPLTQTELLNTLEALSEASTEAIEAIVDSVLSKDLDTSQATLLITSPAVLNNITTAQAEQLFNEIAPTELSPEWNPQLPSVRGHDLGPVARRGRCG